MRYTEAKMTKMTGEMLRDISKETVDYAPNFDETLKEPVVLPSRFPNLLVNGSNGIAVGFVFYVVSKVFSGKAKEINPITWVLLVIFLIYLILL